MPFLIIYQPWYRRMKPNLPGCCFCSFLWTSWKSGAKP